MDKKYRSAIIGISGYGQMHFKDLLREASNGYTEILGATVIDSHKPDVAENCNLLRSMGCRIYDNYQTMFDELAGKLDLCCIPTGIAWHAPMTLAALAAGANVYVEKPAAATLDDIDLMQKHADAAGKFVAVGFQQTYSNNLHQVKRWILDGAIGRVRKISTLALWPRDHHYYQRNDWVGKLYNHGMPVLDSPVNNALAHYLNNMLFCCGATMQASAVPVSLAAELYRANPIESFDTALIQARLNCGAELHYYVSHACSERQNPQMLIEGEKGKILYDIAHCEIDSTELQAQIVFEEYNLMRREVFNGLRRKLSGDAALICTLDNARSHTMIINACHQFFPIYDFDNIEVLPFGEDSNITVAKNLENRMRQAYAQGSFLGSAPGMVNLSNYAKFTGVLQAAAVPA